MKQRFVVRMRPARPRVAGESSSPSRAALRPAAWQAAPRLLASAAGGRRRSSIEGLEGRTYFAVTTDAQGWTVVTPAADTRQVYVSAAGNDANDGLSPAASVRTVARGRQLVRSGSPDQLLLRRGDAFGEPLNSWTASGRSASEPLVIGSYADPNAPSAARPRINSGVANGMSFAAAGVSHVYVMGLAFEADQRDYRDAPANFTSSFRGDGQGGTYGINGTAGLRDFLVEDCAFQYYKTNLVFQPSGSNAPADVRVRRSVIADAYAVNVDRFGIPMGSSQAALGIYAEGVNRLTIDGNVLSHNGWAEDDALGSRRNIYSHNLYINSNNADVTVTNNVIADAASHGVQMRAGGVISNNLFLRNPIAMSYGLVNGAGALKAGGVHGRVTDNVVVGSNAIFDSPRGWGIELANLRPASQGGGTLVKNNVFANDTQNSQAAIKLDQTQGASGVDVGVNDLTIEQNVLYSWTHGLYVHSSYNNATRALTNLVVRGNDFQRVSGSGAIVDHQPAFNAAQEAWANNRYDGVRAETSTNKWFRVGSTSLTYGEWAGQVEPTAQRAQGLFPDPGRTAGGYNASLGGTDSTDAFVAQALRQGRQFWRPAYTADAAGDWVRAGYAGGRIDAAAPTASAAADNVTVGGAAAHTFTVTYADDNKLDLASLGAGDVRVAGPNGYSAAAALVSSTGPADGSRRTATYRVSAPAGGWSAVHNGIYAVVVEPGQVRDVTGKAAAADPAGSFAVSVDPAVPAATAAAAAVTADAAAATVAVTYTGGTSPGLPTDASPANNGFETPNVGANQFHSFQYNPAGGGWSFVGSAGIAGDGSGFTLANPPAPQGGQVAFLQVEGTISQAIPGWQAGTYTVSFKAAQRGNHGTPNHDFRVLVDGQPVGTFTPAGAAYTAYQTASFTVPAGDHTVSFVGLNSAGGDQTSLIDDVRITGTTPPGQQQMSAASFGPGDVRVTGPGGFAATATAAAADAAGDGVQRVVTYTVPAPAGGWSAAGVASLSVDVVVGQVTTTSGAAVPAGRVGTLAVGVDAPIVTAVTASDIPAGSTSPHTFTVTYVDNAPGAALPNSVGPGDVRVSGPSGFNAAAAFVGATGAGTAASPLVATYTVDPPAAGWGTSTNGTYWINLQPNQIVDADGNAAAAGAIDSFRVAVDATAPLAWSTVADVTAPLTTNRVIRVSYYDVSGVNAATIGAADVRVTGPNGFNAAVALGTTSTSGNAASVEYLLAPRDGRWQTRHNGTYSVVLQPAEVADARGNAAAAAVTIATFPVALETAPPVPTVAAVVPDPRNSAVASLTITFVDSATGAAESVTGFDLADLSLARDGQPVSLAGATLTAVSGSAYTLNNLAGVTGAVGTYTLAVAGAGSGVVDAAGNAGTTGTSRSWTVETTPPTVAISPVQPDPRETPVDAVTVTFSEAVTGFDAGDLTLTRDGQAVPLGGATISSADGGRTYTVGGLSGPTGATGGYRLAVAAPAGIADRAGNPLAAGAATTFAVNLSTSFGALADGGFEEPALGGGTTAYQYNPAGSAWTFAGYAGLTGNNSAFTSGNPAAPDGTQAAFVQAGGSASQSVGGLAGGRYVVSLRAAQRANHQDQYQVLEVRVDGVAVGTVRPAGAAYDAFTTAGFDLAAGTHTVALVGLNPTGGDNTVFVDDVRLVAAPAAGLADGGFEQPAVGPGTFRYNPDGSAWTFAGYAGLTGNNSAFTSGNPAAPAGAQAAFVQSEGSASQTVGGVAKGRYAVSLRAAQRANYQASYQLLDVRIDGVSVGTVRPTGGGYQAFTTGAIDLTAGSHTVALVGLNPAGGDNTVFVDDVRLVPVAITGPTAELINSATDKKIATLTDGYAIDMRQTGTRLNIQALPLGTAGSIDFRIDGQSVKVESFAPYTIGGDNGSDYLDWTPPVGQHTLTVVQYSGSGATGNVLATTTLTFTVIAAA